MSFYRYITESRNDSQELKDTMESTVDNLIQYNTDELKPGILLGMIQSGKTRAFTGIIAKCFDNDYQLCIVLTKNSIALVEQTLKRLKTEFILPVDRSRLYVWDVIKLQDGQLTGYILNQKNIIIVKKEVKNMEALEKLFDDVPELNEKKILIVDDEADQASVSFYADRLLDDGFGVGSVASSISRIRQQLGINASFLQVTATPYSLYLQPDALQVNQEEFAPQRPAFTNVLNPHPAYIGGKYYFEESIDINSPASYIHVNLDESELDTLNFKGARNKNDYDQRLRDNLLITDRFKGFRTSILNYLIGGAIRQIQEKDEDFWNTPYHSAFLMHTSSMQKVHRAQNRLVELFIEKLTRLDGNSLIQYISPLYSSIAESIELSQFLVPSLNEVIDAIISALANDHIGIIEVNSENQIAALLGDNGQLRLDNPFNIFVGGQSLDRGITIDHLIGFFYGRNPDRFQMDTVLQHSRMYGTRSKEDLSVTRFYTTPRIYQSMRNMYLFDKDLREDIVRYGGNATVRFIAKQGNTIIPSGPHKLKASCIYSFKAFSRMLPVGFQTKSRTEILRTIENIDRILQDYGNGQENFTMPYDEVRNMILMIRETFTYEPRFGNVGLEWNITPFIKALEVGIEKHNTDQIIIYHKTDRNASRLKQGNSFGDAPDDGRTDLPISRGLAANGPVLMLLRQNGAQNPEGWRDAAFYWPVLIMPANMPNYVYTEE